MRNNLAAFIIIATALAVTLALASGFFELFDDMKESYSTVTEDAGRLQGKERAGAGYIINPDHEVTGRNPDWDEPDN